jgi:hypothetical protein
VCGDEIVDDPSCLLILLKRLRVDIDRFENVPKQLVGDSKLTMLENGIGRILDYTHCCLDSIYYLVLLSGQSFSRLNEG